MLARSFLLLAVLVACGGHAPPSAPSDKLGKEISFSLPSDEGALITVPIAGAKATLLDFFGPTCEPCKKAVPALHARRGELSARGVRLVLIGVLGDGESTDDAKRALASWGVTAPFLVDNAETSRREAGVTALPSTILVDASGVAKWVAPVGATVDDVVAATE